MQLKFRYLLLFILIVLLLTLVGLFFETALQWTAYSNHKHLGGVGTALPVRKVPSSDGQNASTQRNCRFDSCFNILKCHIDSGWRVKVYIYPEEQFITEYDERIFPEATKEFKKIISAIRGSKFWTNDSTEACIFVPNVDILSERVVLTTPAASALSSLEFWNGGENHILFNFFQKKSSSANALTIKTGKAMVVSADFNQLNFRPKFDLVIPVINSFANPTEVIREIPQMRFTEKRKWLLIIQYGAVSRSMKAQLEDIIDTNKGDVLYLSYCEDANMESATRERCMATKSFAYPDILRDGTFCLVLPSTGLLKTFLVDAMMHGCIPVFLQGYLKPFMFVIDWKRASITLNVNQLKDLLKILKQKDTNQLALYRKQVVFLWEKYFSSLQKVTLTTLEILNDRISPHKAKMYEDWNGHIDIFQNGHFTTANHPPLFLPLAPPQHRGYTAVILTFNRNKVLFQLISHLGKSPSLDKIVIIWNNPKVNPPAVSKIPNISKPLVVIRAEANKLSNRFYPYKEIETDAILSIDDDISMLTVDELEFGFHVWKQNSDRLVGFPGRNHKQWSSNNKQGFLYQSEWSNDISMVLTGVAFYHKIYNYLFTYKMPKGIVRYIDKRMNCEDIAMNFLIANLTRKSPIKVTTRKRFICPQCSSNESLWSETSHFLKRSECLVEFTKYFGHMPLQRVEFRADPVLFKENVPEEIKAFPDVGFV